MTEKYDPWALAEAYRVICTTSPNENPVAYKAATSKWAEQNQLKSVADASYVYKDLASFKASPFSQDFAADRCLNLKQAIESGDDSAVIEAVAVCLDHGLSAPAWLVNHFVERYQKVVTGELREWSDKGAFGSPYLQSGVNKKGIFALHHIAPKAYRIGVKILSSPDEPIRAVDKSLYEDIAEQLPDGNTKLGGTRIQEIIKEYLQDGLLPPFAFIREQFKNGLNAEEMSRAWYEKTHKKMQYVECEDGIRRRSSDTGIPGTLNLSGFTDNTQDSPIKPLQPKGKLNDLSSVKPKPSRKTAKTPRS
jgi:hypothetical protein